MIILPELTYTSVQRNFRPFLIKEIYQKGSQLLYIAEDEASLRQITACLKALTPDLPCLTFPGWDCLPYDRSSPRADLMAERVQTLCYLADHSEMPLCVVTSVNAILQKLPPKRYFQNQYLLIRQGQTFERDNFIKILLANQFLRAATVREPGEFSIRGSLLDIFPAQSEMPLRVDFFGDEIESIHTFDPLTQRRNDESINSFMITPTRELFAGEEERRRFKDAYRHLFGHAGKADLIYRSVGEEQLAQGIEHWSPLFYEPMMSLVQFMNDPVIYLDSTFETEVTERLTEINDYYETRLHYQRQEDESIYNPLPPNYLYETEESLKKTLESYSIKVFTPLSPPPSDQMIDMGSKGLPFVPSKENFVPLKAFLKETKSKKTYICAATPGSLERLGKILKEKEIENLVSYESWEKAQALPKGCIGLLKLDIEAGFTSPMVTILTEQDILGDRLRTLPKKKKRSDLFIAESSSINEGDYVVHENHGIGQYQGLVSLDINGAAHDCLALVYDGGDKLFVPVENLEMLTRYGGDFSDVRVDKLGHAAWQARKAKVKTDLLAMAEGLIKIAASRKHHATTPIHGDSGSYDEFCARFPYTETDDQLQATEDVLADLKQGVAMDRLICGDVGFGKTEVALRAAFTVVNAGKQVAIITPTTLLCRQHFKTFQDRFAGFDSRIEQLSRLVSASKASSIKASIATGDINIIVGTHALLSETVSFKNLGLVIVDEEQHFGVRQKEKLKELRTDAHVLTLTATPIPRTLQLAMHGVREMSLIATPPVDRLAVRTFITPFDGVVIQEALIREHHRGGQSFYVCPRIKDLSDIHKKLMLLVPELKIVTAHGQMQPKDLEDVMDAFYQGTYDVLLATNIIESGIDVPNANTLIVHRSDLFGLSQLYQLRGRIGRSKTRAYAYFTLPPEKTLSRNAEKRLHVMQTLDTLGAGFQLASYDLDIRGAGNILGDQQSGHIKEIGVELYQQMLHDAIEEIQAKRNRKERRSAETWSPQLNLGISVLIPENYVADLSVRLDLYRRLSHMESEDHIDSFMAELIDRFGSAPEEVENLMSVIALKLRCKKACVEKIDVGRKGFSLSFYKNTFPEPEALLAYIQRYPARIKLKPNHSLVYLESFHDTQEILQGLQRTLDELMSLVSTTH